MHDNDITSDHFLSFDEETIQAIKTLPVTQSKPSQPSPNITKIILANQKKQPQSEQLFKNSPSPSPAPLPPIIFICGFGKDNIYCNQHMVTFKNVRFPVSIMEFNADNSNILSHIAGAENITGISCKLVEKNGFDIPAFIKVIYKTAEEEKYCTDLMPNNILYFIGDDTTEKRIVFPQPQKTIYALKFLLFKGTFDDKHKMVIDNSTLSGNGLFLFADNTNIFEVDEADDLLNMGIITAKNSIKLQIGLLR